MHTALNWTLIGATVFALLLSAAFLAAALWDWRGPHRNRRLAIFAVFLVASPVLAATQRYLYFYVLRPSVQRERDQRRMERADAAAQVRVGDAAPAFRLTDANGAEIASADLKGKVVLVNFFATWCGPCLRELPHLQKLWDENRDNDAFAMIVIGREETDKAVAEFKAKRGYSFPMAADPERAVYSLFATDFIPRTYLISPDGIICFAATGFVDDLADLERELANQLQRCPGF